MPCFRTPLTVYLLTSFWLASAAAQQQHWLQAGQQRIPASVFESRKQPMQGGVVVLVAGGNSGAWPHSLHALGRYLPDDGWTTVLVDLHTAATQQAPNDFVPQLIGTAVDYLRTQNVQRFVLVAAGGMAFQVLNAAEDKSLAGLQGLVLLDSDASREAAGKPADFSALKMPLLDLLTQRGKGQGAATRRKLFARQHNMRNYQQVLAPAAGPNWRQRRDPVVQRVRGWLRKSG